MKKILIVMVMFFTVFLLNSCDIFKQHVSATGPANGTDEGEITVIDLVAPSYVKYENGSLKWEKIENASKYCILINELF